MSEIDPVWGFRIDPAKNGRESRVRASIVRGEITGWTCTGKYLRAGSNCTPQLFYRTGQPDLLFVIKRLHLQPILQHNEYLHLRREIRALQVLSHPSVIQLVEHGVDTRGDEYVILPYFPLGHTSQIALSRIAPAKMVSMLHDLAAAVDAIHSLGVAHNDINPVNVLQAEDRFVLADFGCAAVRNSPTRDVLQSTEWRNWTWIDTFRLGKFSHWALRAVYGSFSLPSVVGEPSIDSPLRSGLKALRLLDLMVRRVPDVLTPRAIDLAAVLDGWRSNLD